MASWVLTECGIRPLQIYPRPRKGFSSNPIKIKPKIVSFDPKLLLCVFSSSKPSFSRERKLEVKVSAQLTVASPSPIEDEKSENGLEEFDPGSPPPFKLSDIKAAIPKHCWVKNPWKSMSYVVRDVTVIFGLAAAASYLNNWFVWPLYWFAQGTMFWALWCLGHDCGHGSFSNNPKLNSFVGHMLHSSILTPYNGWRISHRTHHQNHGHADNDESWHPVREEIYRNLDSVTKAIRHTFPLALFVWLVYLGWRSPGKTGSHFDPNCELFAPNERKGIVISTACCLAMAALLVGLTFVMGPIQMIKLYWIPYFICVMWLDLVTYLHHHDNDEQLPWYRGKEWSYLRGGLSTHDRDYGWINNIHHDMGTHLVHHLFPQIPHYHIVEATKAVKPVLGKYYKEPQKSGPFPFHLVGTFIKSINKDHYVSDSGDVVYYETDPNFQL